jgi:hypothetical protein
MIKAPQVNPVEAWCSDCVGGADAPRSPQPRISAEFNASLPDVKKIDLGSNAYL